MKYYTKSGLSWMLEGLDQCEKGGVGVDYTKSGLS